MLVRYNVELGKDYPNPLVNFEGTRDKAMLVYNKLEKKNGY